jgi:hypothetical protein
MGKAKNEHEFTTVRIMKTTLPKLAKLNIEDIKAKNKKILLYQTIDSAADKLLLGLQKSRAGKKIAHSIENNLQNT